MGERAGQGHALPVIVHAPPVVTWPVEDRGRPLLQSLTNPRWRFG
jgi:hypothetical protein